MLSHRGCPAATGSKEVCMRRCRPALGSLGNGPQWHSNMQTAHQTYTVAVTNRCEPASLNLENGSPLTPWDHRLTSSRVKMEARSHVQTRSAGTGRQRAARACYPTINLRKGQTNHGGHVFLVLPILFHYMCNMLSRHQSISHISWKHASCHSALNMTKDGCAHSYNRAKPRLFSTWPP